MREEKLIRLISRYSALYNTKCSEYRDASCRNAAWEEIAHLYGKSVEECKETWNKLRNCYTNALKRRQKKSSKAEKIPPWRLEEEMSFLKPFIHGRLSENFDATVKNENSPPPSPEVVMFAESPTYPENSLSHTSSPKVKKRKTRSCSDDHLDDVIEVKKSSHEREKVQEMDDWDMFFLSMSKMVKKLPRVDQIHIKMNLVKAISEAELKHLE